MSNPGQADANGNGIGDACEGNDDGDDVPEPPDNCPDQFICDQFDTDSDGLGDACDPDDDDDGFNDPADNCPLDASLTPTTSMATARATPAIPTTTTTA